MEDIVEATLDLFATEKIANMDAAELNTVQNSARIFDTYEEFVDAFELYGSEWGFHTITKIQEVTLGKVWLG